jgi:hypothetical protein
MPHTMVLSNNRKIRATSHVSTETLDLGRYAIPLWGSLLLYAVRKWQYGASSVISKCLIDVSPFPPM